MTRRLKSPQRTRSAGVTLIELAITIALVGILAALIVQFVAPVRSYIDSSRRAALSDTADTALRRVGRDLRLALPNSVRVDGTRKFVEFVLVRTGGRYRYESDPAATNTCSTPTADVLDFAAADTCFKTIGNLYSPASDISTVTSSDYVVVFNLQPGTANADVYEFSGTGGNKSKVSAAVNFTGEDRITIANHLFTYESPGRRFFIVEGPVTYGCSGGVLTRYWGYAFNASQVAPPTGGSSATMATGVADCDFTYNTSAAAQGIGLVTMWLKLSMQDSQGGTENVNLSHAVHVNNVP
jgi:MSHA biogenesis protein MshO